MRSNRLLLRGLTDVLTCEECGCLVDPEMTETHQDWHESLVKIASVANPNRTQINEPWPGIFVQDC